MRKLLLLLLFILYMAGCSSTPASRPPADPEAQQFRNQQMELYRTMESMPRSYPIIILKPAKGHDQ